MKWWHRWRLRVWQMRYFYARGRLSYMTGNEPDYDQALADRMTAESAVQYHWEKAGRPA